MVLVVSVFVGGCICDDGIGGIVYDGSYVGSNTCVICVSVCVFVV